MMYLITYVDRVNIATAASAIQKEFSLSNKQLGLVLSAFGYPYIVFQIFGGWLGDRVGARRTLFVCGLVWAGATILTGFAGGLSTLLLARVVVGLGEGATFPVATRAMQTWTSPERRGFAQGLTHAFSRFGNTVTPPIVVWLISLVLWRGSFVVLGCTSLVWVTIWVWYYRDNPADHPRMTRPELSHLPLVRASGAGRPVQVPWGPLARRMLPVTVVYFCYGWMLWMYLNWLPTYFLNEFHLELKKSALFATAVFAAGVGGDYLGGVISDAIFRRTGDVRRARCHLVVAAFLASFACVVPIFLTRDLTVVVFSLAGAFFCAELVIGPMWAIPMDIAPDYSGTASGFMNTGSAVAAAFSPLAFGYVVDLTGNWNLPFLFSMGLLLFGAGLAFSMHPEQQFRPALEDLRLRTAD
jgi:MFS family permease